MSSRLLLGLLIVAFAGLEVYLHFSPGKPSWPYPKRAFQRLSLNHTHHDIFSNADEELEAYRIYRDIQDSELQALNNALEPNQWGESVAVKFAVMPPEGTRLIWDVFGPFYNCPSKERVGTPPVAWDGGKWMCGVQVLRQKVKCIVYSFGSNGEVSFEQHLLSLTKNNCEVHVFDHSLTPQQARKVTAIRGVALHKYGIGKEDIAVHSPFQYGDHMVNEYQLKSLPSIMAELQHSWVDVLKMDIEGAEYEVLPALVAHYSALNQSIPVTQAQIEYHHWSNRPLVAQVVDTLKTMEAGGFRTFSTEFNINGEAWNFIEYSYLHVGNSGRVVTQASIFGQGVTFAI